MPSEFYIGALNCLPLVTRFKFGESYFEVWINPSSALLNLINRQNGVYPKGYIRKEGYFKAFNLSYYDWIFLPDNLIRIIK